MGTFFGRNGFFTAGLQPDSCVPVHVPSGVVEGFPEIQFVIMSQIHRNIWYAVMVEVLRQFCFVTTLVFFFFAASAFVVLMHRSAGAAPLHEAVHVKWVPFPTVDDVFGAFFAQIPDADWVHEVDEVADPVVRLVLPRDVFRERGVGGVVEAGLVNPILHRVIVLECRK